MVESIRAHADSIRAIHQSLPAFDETMLSVDSLSWKMLDFGFSIGDRCIFTSLKIMNILYQQSGTKGSFYYEENNQRLAEMTFTMAGDKLMIIDHTDVSDALRGKGAGKQMVEAAVIHARKNNLKIIPLCPFAKSVFEKVKEYQDVLDR